jgi:hypothetical protein
MDPPTPWVWRAEAGRSDPLRGGPMLRLNFWGPRPPNGGWERSPLRSRPHLFDGTPRRANKGEWYPAHHSPFFLSVFLARLSAIAMNCAPCGPNGELLPPRRSTVVARPQASPESNPVFLARLSAIVCSPTEVGELPSAARLRGPRREHSNGAPFDPALRAGRLPPLPRGKNSHYELRLRPQMSIRATAATNAPRAIHHIAA